MNLVKSLSLAAVAWLCTTVASAQGNSLIGNLSYYTPGNQQVKHAQFDPQWGKYSAGSSAPFKVESQVEAKGDEELITVKVTATETAYFRVEYIYPFEGTADGCQYYMPGFWYHKNMRSPKEAPSFKTSKSWTVREDRLSTPLTGIFNAQTGNSIVVLRHNPHEGTD